VSRSGRHAHLGYEVMGENRMGAGYMPVASYWPKAPWNHQARERVLSIGGSVGQGRGEEKYPRRSPTLIGILLGGASASSTRTGSLQHGISEKFPWGFGGRFSHRCLLLQRSGLSRRGTGYSGWARTRSIRKTQSSCERVGACKRSLTIKSWLPGHQNSQGDNEPFLAEIRRGPIPNS